MNLGETESAARPDKTGSPGTLLGEARQEQGLSVADVARQLKLSVHQVEALEAGEYDKLPGPVFVRGFIRNYARFLKLDPEALVHSAARRLPPDEPLPATPPSREIPFPTVAPPRWPRYAVALALAAIALAVYEFYLGDSRTMVTRLAPAPTPTTGSPLQPESQQTQPGVPAMPETTAGAPGQTSDADQSAKPPPAVTAQNALAVSAAVPAQQARHASDARENEVAPRPEEREIRLIFEEESWVEIRDRTGKAIFSQLNRRGTEKRLNGKPPLSVVVGNSHGVRLTYDDQPVDLSRYTKIDVARLTLQ